MRAGISNADNLWLFFVSLNKNGRIAGDFRRNVDNVSS